MEVCETIVVMKSPKRSIFSTTSRAARAAMFSYFEPLLSTVESGSGKFSWFGVSVVSGVLLLTFGFSIAQGLSEYLIRVSSDGIRQWTVLFLLTVGPLSFVVVLNILESLIDRRPWRERAFKTSLEITIAAMGIMMGARREAVYADAFIMTNLSHVVLGALAASSLSVSVGYVILVGYLHQSDGAEGLRPACTSMALATVTLVLASSFLLLPFSY